MGGVVWYKMTEEFPHSATVSTVIDGDTIDVIIHGKQQRVRLLGIDAPETGECGAATATSTLAGWLPPGTSITLVKDLSANTDEYGRLLRFVEIADGGDVGKKLVETGLVGAWYPKSATPPSRYPTYVVAETIARMNHTGSWVTCPTLGR